MTKVAQSASDLASTSPQCFHSIDSWVPPCLLFQILKRPTFSKYKDAVYNIHMNLVNPWEWPQNIANMPMEKGSNSLGICHHVLCLGRLRSKHASLHKQQSLTFTFPHHIHSVPTTRATPHRQRCCHSPICPQLPPSHPHTSARPLLQQWHWLCVQGGPWSTFPNWSLRAQLAGETKRAFFQTPAIQPQTHSFTDGQGLEDWGIGQ